MRKLFARRVILLTVLSLFALTGTAAALLLADSAVGRLVSVEAGVVLVGWSAIWLSAGYRHWVQLVSVALGVAVVVLSLIMPAPG